MNKTILLVEDDIVTAKAISVMLEKNGYRLIIARSGLEAVAFACSKADIGLILMDIDLGDGIDGAEAAKKILAERAIPIVFLTFDPEKDYVDRVKDVPRYGYILKNSGNFVLLSSVEMAFELFYAHEEMRKSEEKYRLVFDHSPLALVHYDENGIITACNEVFAQGIGTSIKALIGLDMFKLPNVKLKEALRISLDGSIGHYEGLYISFTAEKSTFVRVVFAPLKSPEGYVIGGVGVVEDTTERKTALELLKKTNEELEATNEELTATNEEFEAMNDELLTSNQELSQKEEEIRLIIDNSPISIQIIDNEGYNLRVNASYSILFGALPPEDYSVFNDPLLQHWPRSLELMDRLRIGEVVFFPEFYYNPVDMDKSLPDKPIWLRMIGYPLKSVEGKPVRFVLMHEDITDRKKVTAQLKLEKKKTEERERNYREIFDSSNDAIFIHDSETGVILDVNKTMLKMYGFDNKNEIVQGNIGKLSASQDAYSNEKVRDMMHKALESKNRTFEWYAKKKNGELFWIEVTLKSTIINGENRIMATVRDISEQRKIEEAVQKAQKLESLGVLAGGIAHDFNNLLGGIFGCIDLAKLKNKDTGLTGYFEGAMSAIERARDLTQQLLTFSRGGAPVMKPVSLSPFIQDTVQFALSGSNISCRFDIPDDLPSCFFDKNQIAQVIDNLIINSQQSMPAGGVIDVSARSIFLKEQEHAILRTGKYVRISVKDKGVGIPEEMIPFIFDPFFSTKAKGHGLGLATCYSIMNRHGGAIDVESIQGDGCTFHIYLPVSEKHADIASEKNVISHSGSGRILIMDDDEIILDILEEMLSEFGYSVITMKEGKEAVNYYNNENMLNHKFAAIIFDLTVPGGMGGVEAVAEIRKINQVIPVFVSSGYSEDTVMAKPQDFGFTASIRKPFQISELSEMLEKHIAGNREIN